MDREDIRMSELHTLVKCAHCERGVRNEYSVDGMCPSCAEAELERLRRIEAALNNDILESGPILYFRRLAKQALAKGRDGDAYYLNAIADALEANRGGRSE